MAQIWDPSGTISISGENPEAALALDGGWEALASKLDAAGVLGSSRALESTQRRMVTGDLVWAWQEGEEGPELGSWVETATGPVFIPLGIPSWVADELVKQAGGFRGEPPRTGPSGAAVPSLAPRTGNRPTPTRPPTPPGAEGRSGASGSALGAAARAVGGALGATAGRVVDVGGDVLARARDLLGPAADATLSVVGAITGTARSLIESFAPTVADIALGTMQKFLDLAGFLGGNLATVGDFAGGIAGGFGAALEDVFGGAFAWLTKGLLFFLRALASPLMAGYQLLVQRAPSPAL